MRNMFAWQIKTAQWTRDAAIDVSTADSRSVSASAWLKKVRTHAFHPACLRITSNSESCNVYIEAANLLVSLSFKHFLCNGINIYPNVTLRTAYSNFSKINFLKRKPLFYLRRRFSELTHHQM